jgi:hypothetical protein
LFLANSSIIYNYGLLRTGLPDMTLWKKSELHVRVRQVQPNLYLGGVRLLHLIYEVNNIYQCEWNS